MQADASERVDFKKSSENPPGSARYRMMADMSERLNNRKK
jgi:hypothetical protein